MRNQGIFQKGVSEKNSEKTLIEDSVEGGDDIDDKNRESFITDERDDGGLDNTAELVDTCHPEIEI